MRIEKFKQYRRNPSAQDMVFPRNGPPRTVRYGLMEVCIAREVSTAEYE